ncbi:MAG: hypothetical protein ACR2F2_04815 [Pyrinomonadaceae bacterium]
MKKCPKCNEHYYDDNLNFCLTDGERLFFPNDSVPTVVIDPKTLKPNDPPDYSQKPEKSVSPYFAYITISLLSIIIGVSLVILLKPEVIFSGKNDSGNSNANIQTNQNVAYLVNNAQNELTNVNLRTEPPRPPVSSSKTRGLKRYDGTLGGQSASFDLVWNNDNSVTGNYYLDNNINYIYSVDGTNYAQGRVKLNIYDGSRRIGQMQIYKTLEGKILCWQADFYDTSKKYVRLCRKR